MCDTLVGYNNLARVVVPCDARLSMSDMVMFYQQHTGRLILRFICSHVAASLFVQVGTWHSPLIGLQQVT